MVFSFQVTGSCRYVLSLGVIFFYAVESVLVSCAKIINELLDDVWAKAPRSSV